MRIFIGVLSIIDVCIVVYHFMQLENFNNRKILLKKYGSGVLRLDSEMPNYSRKMLATHLSIILSYHLIQDTETCIRLYEEDKDS